MNRRGFLKLLGYGAAGAVAAQELDLDRLLWVPGEKTIFLPAFEPHTFDPCDWMTRESLRILKERLQFAKSINREYEPPLHVGETVRIHLPQRFERFNPDEELFRIGDKFTLGASPTIWMVGATT